MCSSGWYTAPYFTNLSGSPVSFPVGLFDGNGNPLSASAIGGASTTVSLQPRGTALIAFPNAGALAQGYVSIALPSGVTGYGVFRQNVPGVPDQEAVQSILPTTAGVTGSVDFTVPSANVAALGLRFNGTAFTSIPTSDR